MYVSDKVKENLRQYEGQAVTVDATKVYQPMNPGDGLIEEFKFLGLVEPRKPLHEKKGLVLTANPKFEKPPENLFSLPNFRDVSSFREMFGTDKYLRFEIEIRNDGTRKVELSPWSVTPTVFGEKNFLDFDSPSDGKSTARITRCQIPLEECGYQVGSVSKNPAGQEVTYRYNYLLRADEKSRSLDSFSLNPGEVKRFNLALTLPPGKHEFLFSCPGNEYERYEFVSNIVFFNVDGWGAATFISDRRLTEHNENSHT